MQEHHDVSVKESKQEVADDVVPSKGKNILLTVTGSRGDIQPMLVIGLKFIEKGYHVRLATHEEYRELATSVGITDFVGLSGNPSEIMNSPEIKKLFQEGSTFKALQQLAKAGKPFMRVNMKEIREAFSDIDAVVYNATTPWAVLPLAELHKIPVFASYTLPVYPTTEMAPAVMGMTTTGFGFVFPPPTVVNENDDVTDTSVLKTPFNQNWKPSKELKEFLARDTDRPPIYVGFGSMSMFDNKKILSIVVPAIQKLKARCILCAGWSDIDNTFFNEVTKNTPNDFLLIKFAPHDWLFTKCSIIVHHGGAGTTGSSLLTGKPSVICSVLADQPFWGKTLVEKKLGYHLAMKDLTSDKLYKALVHVSSDEVKKNVTEMSQKMSNENGAKDHVEKIIERLNTNNVYIPKI